MYESFHRRRWSRWSETTRSACEKNDEEMLKISREKEREKLRNMKMQYLARRRKKENRDFANNNRLDDVIVQKITTENVLSREIIFKFECQKTH